MRDRRDVVPPFARLFLAAHRRDLEVRQHAQSLFLTRELFATRARTGVLILVSLFERRIEILPDTGLHARVSEADWRGVVERDDAAPAADRGPSTRSRRDSPPSTRC